MHKSWSRGLQMCRKLGTAVSCVVGRVPWGCKGIYQPPESSMSRMSRVVVR